MSQHEKKQTVSGRRIVWITGLSCAACCALPLIGALIGSTALIGLAEYSETLAVVIAAFGVFLLVMNWKRKLSSAACNPYGCNEHREQTTDEHK